MAHAGKGHFICGNVIYAEPYSRHMRNLYERRSSASSERSGTVFGDIGPKLLSDYIASDDGAALQEWLFSPMFFNAIDWTEIDQFNQPVAELADYLNDERVIRHPPVERAHPFGRAGGRPVADRDAVQSARAHAELHQPRRPLQHRQEPPHR